MKYAFNWINQTTTSSQLIKPYLPPAPHNLKLTHVMVGPWSHTSFGLCPLGIEPFDSATTRSFSLISLSL